MELSLALSLPALAMRGGGEPPEPLPDPLDPNTLAFPITAAWSLRKAVPTYAGNAQQWRDSGNVLRTLGWDVDGNINFANRASWGNGVTFGVATWYDQSGNAHNLTSINNIRPSVGFDLLTTKAGFSQMGVDYRAKDQHLATTTTPLDIGGTNSFAIFVVAGTWGWSSAGTHARNPGVSGVNAPLIGYGTASGGSLIHGAYTGNGETTMYFKNGELFVERGSIPDQSRIRNFWFNQRGAVVDGGADTRVLWEDRPHGVAEILANRFCLGTVGSLNQSHNGPIFEVLYVKHDGSLTAEDCQRIAIWQRLYWGNLGKANFPDQYEMILSGQSLQLFLDTPDGTSIAQDVVEAIIVPETKAALNIPASSAAKTLEVYCGDVAYGGTSIMKLSQTSGFWYNEATDAPGDMLTQWQTNALTQLRRAPRYKKAALGWAQGEADAIFLTSNAANRPVFKAGTIKVLTQMRAWIGRDVPIMLGVVGRQSGQTPGVRIVRQVQAEIAAEMSGVYLQPDIYHLSRQDSVHLAKSPPNDDGFAVRGRHHVRLFSFLTAADPAAFRNWDAPFISAATLVSGTIIDLTITYPENCAGTDIATLGELLGFSVAGRALTSVQRLNPNTIRILGSGFIAGDLVTYDPFDETLNRLQFPLDNTPGLPMPLRPVWGMAVAA